MLAFTCHDKVDLLIVTLILLSWDPSYVFYLFFRARNRAYDRLQEA